MKRVKQYVVGIGLGMAGVFVGAMCWAARNDAQADAWEQRHVWNQTYAQPLEGPRPPKEEVERFEEVRLQLDRAFLWWYSMDVYLSASEVKQGKPAVEDVSLSSARLLGDGLFIHFASNKDRRRHWMVNASEIVAIRLDLKSPAMLRSLDEIDGNRQQLLRERFPAQDQWGAGTFGCEQIYEAFVIAPEIYLDAADVASNTPMRPQLRLVRCYPLHNLTFARFRTDNEDEMWMLNMGRIVAFRLDDGRLQP